MNNIDIKENKGMENQSVPNYLIDELRSIESLSVRAFSACWRANLKDLKSIIEFFEAGNDDYLLRLRNCSIKTLAEVKAVYRKYRNKNIIDDNSIQRSNDIGNEIKPDTNYFQKKSRELIRKSLYSSHSYNNDPEKQNSFSLNVMPGNNDIHPFLLYQMKYLSTRAFNAIINFANDNKLGILQTIELIKFYPIKIKNVGVLTVPEIINFHSKIQEMLSELIALDNASTKPVQSISLTSFINSIKAKYKFDISGIDNDFECIFEQKKLPLLKVIYYFFFKGEYFDNLEKEILQTVFYLKEKLFSKIAKIFNLSEERIRQKKIILVAGLFHRYGILSSLINDIKQYSIYEGDIPGGNIICIDKLYLNNIFHKTRKLFRGNFLAKLISLYNGKYYAVSYDKRKQILIDTLSRDYCNLRFKTTNNYLIKKEIDYNNITRYIVYIINEINQNRNENAIIGWHKILTHCIPEYIPEYVKYRKNLEIALTKNNEKLDEAKNKIIKELSLITSGITCNGLYYKNKKLDKCYFRGATFLEELWREIDILNLSNYELTGSEEINKEIKKAIYNYSDQCESINQEYTEAMKSCEEKMNNLFSEYIDVFKTIARNEYGSKFTHEGIVIKRNIKGKQALANAIVIKKFEEIGKPMNIKELTQALIESNIFLKKQAILKACQKNLEIISTGKFYALKKWEKEQPGLKIGSIRDIVKEYLNKLATPVHRDKIVNYVAKYWNTDKDNIIANLKSDSKKRFCFFPNGYIGLKSKNYYKNE